MATLVCEPQKQCTCPHLNTAQIMFHETLKPVFCCRLFQRRYSLTYRLPGKLNVLFCCQASTSLNRNQTHVTEAVTQR